MREGRHIWHQRNGTDWLDDTPRLLLAALGVLRYQCPMSYLGNHPGTLLPIAIVDEYEEEMIRSRGPFQLWRCRRSTPVSHAPRKCCFRKRSASASGGKTVL